MVLRQKDRLACPSGEDYDYGIRLTVTIMKYAVVALAVIAALCMGACGRVDHRGLLQADVKGQVSQAIQSQDTSKLQQAVGTGQQDQVQSAIQDQITSSSSAAEKVPDLLAKLGNVTAPENPQLASQLPSSAQQLEQTTGVTKSDLQKVAEQVAGQQGTTTVQQNPQAAEPAVTQLLQTVGAGGANQTNQTGSSGGRRLHQASNATSGVAAPILLLYRKALAAAICANPQSAAGALGAGIPSSNNEVALATLQGLADASNTCCDKAAQAADAGYKVAQSRGQGDLYIFRLLFAIFRTNVQFCAIPASFFTGS